MNELLFVSLARKNEEKVRAILSQLSQSGLNYWVYYRDVKAGRDWRVGSRKAVVEASHFMVFLSPDSLKSRNVRLEIYLASCFNKPIIPVMLEECTEQLSLYEETKWLSDHRIVSGQLELSDLIDEILRRVYASESPSPLNTQRIFITYTATDLDFAEKLSRDIQTMGGKIWFDRWSIHAGEHILDARIQGLIEAEYLLVCLSLEAVKDEQVKRDIQLALSRDLPIVPIITQNGGTASIADLSHAVVNDEFTKDILDINWIRYTESSSELLRQLYEAFEIFMSKANQKHGIFMSYRRMDTASACGRIYDRLVNRYGTAEVYRDVINIPAGADFALYISQLIEQCAVVLILIGGNWATAKDNDGNLRLFSDIDYVRLELEQALMFEDKLLIPVLIGDAPMVTSEQLPVSIQDLLKLNALRVRDDPDFHTDVDRLIERIEAIQAKHKSL